ncbi:hypothetical protein RDI61_01475 [Pseudomonas plecoglossicida]|uniref:Uncharacterized protein n=1 Tax=Pseudomonas putida TaxID=303 RepID=A0A7V8EBX1_PSEPU|nr:MULTISPECIES: hypothetical protein [Pseudomonas]KAF0251978.1 hypothetical protein GN299_25390 [Pseudomonas putida]MCK2124083.1 hypothetical protein [Pseudomonas sp. PNPG3]MDQ7962723.1 hypothetical protein [Pseudomonas plecoglossicida]WFG05279.1 hypothetical protein P3X84_11835 [Pseudomonas putida]
MKTKEFYAAKYQGAWFLFLLVIFTPALMVSVEASELTVSETYGYAFSYIAEHTFVWLGYLLFVPVGTIACLLPNDAAGIIVIPHLIFGDLTIFAVWIFVATTYPPFYRGDAILGE